jgi:hypothetical protein
MKLALLATTALLSVPGALAGPLAYAACQGGCATLVMACYAAGGCTWGATLGATAPATIIACNTGYAGCQATCATVALFAPTL